MTISHRRRRRLESSSRLSSRRLQRDRSRPSQNRRRTVPGVSWSLRWGAATPHELRVLASLARRLRAAHLSSRRVTKPPRYCCKRCEQKIPSIGLPIFCTASGSSGATPARRPPIRWAGPEAGAASTRGDATARRPAVCCPSRLYWVIGTGTTAARTATTSTNKDSGASPRTPTATRPCSSSRTTDGGGSRLRSRRCSRRCRRQKMTAGRLDPWARRSGATCVLDRRLCVRCWCWRTRYDAWVGWVIRMILSLLSTGKRHYHCMNHS